MKFKIHKNVLLFLFVLIFVFLSSVDVVSAQSPTESLILKLQEQVKALQEQLKTLQSEIKTAKTELELVKTELKFTKALKLGVRGEEVTQLQEFLKQFPDIYPQGLVTGYFGPLTESAVRKFQEKNNIESIGVVGPKTLSKLNELVTEGAGSSGVVPPGLLIAPGLQNRLATTTVPVTPVVSATTTPSVATSTVSQATTTPAGTTPAVSTSSLQATPATSATPTSSSNVPTVSATPATPAVATTTPSATASPPINTTPPATTTDTTPPSVTISGLELTDICAANMNFTINDNVGIDKLQFKVDEVAGSEFSPCGGNCLVYVNNICHQSLANGNHTFTVVAKDTAGNVTTESTTFSVFLRSDAPLAISSLSATSITENSATITWVTNQPAFSGVEYSTVPNYVNWNKSNNALITNHSFNLTGLNPATTYYYWARSNTNRERVNADRQTFTTSAATVINSTNATSTSSLTPRSQNLSVISQMLISLDEILKQLSKILK